MSKIGQVVDFQYVHPGRSIVPISSVPVRRGRIESIALKPKTGLPYMVINVLGESYKSFSITGDGKTGIQNMRIVEAVRI